VPPDNGTTQIGDFHFCSLNLLFAASQGPWSIPCPPRGGSTLGASPMVEVRCILSTGRHLPLDGGGWEGVAVGPISGPIIPHP
jgi:hypothetical protein